MPKKYTIQDTLAFADITGFLGRTHAATTEALEGTFKELKDGEIRLRKEGRELAAKSRLHKAHEYLEGKGFHPLAGRSQTKARLTYLNRSGQEAIVAGGKVIRDGKVVETFLNG